MVEDWNFRFAKKRKNFNEEKKRTHFQRKNDDLQRYPCDLQHTRRTGNDLQMQPPAHRTHTVEKVGKASTCNN